MGCYLRPVLKEGVRAFQSVMDVLRGQEMDGWMR